MLMTSVQKEIGCTLSCGSRTVHISPNVYMSVLIIVRFCQEDCYWQLILISCCLFEASVQIRRLCYHPSIQVRFVFHCYVLVTK